MQKKLLIIEDNKDIRDLITMALEDLDLHVLAAHTAQDIESICSEHEFDLVIADFHIEDFCLKSFLSLSKHKKSKVIVISGSRDLDLNKLEEYGMNLFIKKPFELSEIQRAVASYLASD